MQQMILGYLDVPSHHFTLLFKENLQFLLYGRTAVVEVWDSHFCRFEVSSLTRGLLRPLRMIHSLRVLLSLH